MTKISVEEFVMRLGNDAMNKQIDQTTMGQAFKHKVEKLESGQCKSVKARAFGMMVDHNHPSGHRHYCIEVNIEIEHNDFLNQMKKDIEERVEDVNKKLKGISVNIIKAVPLRATVEPEVILFDSCSEHDQYRTRKDLTCETKINPN